VEKAYALFAIDVYLVRVGDHAELGEVEMGIERLQGIESPGYAIGDAVRQDQIALGRLQPKAQIMTAVIRIHREHMRVVNDTTANMAIKAIYESSQFSPVESADQTSTDPRRRYKLMKRDDISFVLPPDLRL
jgi:hypothetical protein